MSGDIPYARFAGWVSQSAGKETMSNEKLERRVKIAEAALWILADKYITEGCFDRDDKTPTDVVREARWQAEINMHPNARNHDSSEAK